MTHSSDPHSFSEPTQVRVRHTGLRLDVDFSRQVVAGTATLRLERIQRSAPLVLDTRGLQILKVEGTGDAADTASALWEPPSGWSELRWTFGEPHPVLGRALTIELGEAVVVRVTYETSPEASGLQWLDPQQTADRAAPFLYSQSQAIHARSWIPCQDTPGVRMTFDAVVNTDPQFQALMAAEGPQAGSTAGRAIFEMPQPIPAYLLALAVGKLEFVALGERTGVWAEPSVIDAAAYEFADVQAMLELGEELYGPYRWGRYDLLVLPPAFPFGGMENPRLTFATPTILAGDRSLVSLVAHELAHSWSGNLVTNATWSDLWLNEGFTVYFERRIVEALYGRQRAEMEAMLGRQSLEESFAELLPADQRLKTDLTGRDPDDAMTHVPYEKGALFLRMLEEVYGRSAWDAFLKAWFEEHAFTSVSTDDFLAFLDERLISVTPVVSGFRPPDIQAWVFAPGLGPQAPNPKVEAFTLIDQEVAEYLSGARAATELTASEWQTHQWLHFLRSLPSSVSAAQLEALDKAWSLTDSGNSEILAQWLEVGITRGYKTVDSRVESFLIGVGRRKFLTPLYRALLTANRREDALRIYAEARDGYHAIAQGSLDALLNAR